MFLLTASLLAPSVAAQSEGHFVPPHSDSGVDTDADGLYNILSLQISVNATTPGLFFIFVDLKDGANATLITSGSIAISLDGPTIVAVNLEGLAIRESGIDGPYNANLLLFDDTFSPDDYDEHVTGPYLHTDFEQIAAILEPPHSDMGIDRDSPVDGEYNVLQVDVSINVTDAGIFEVNAILLNSTEALFITSDTWYGVLPAGVQSVPLIFPGVEIRSSGLDGPYFVNLTLLDPVGGGFPVVLDGGGHITAAYYATDFESTTPATVTGIVQDATTSGGIAFASVTAYNYLDSIVRFISADSAGNYVLDLYEGDWVVTYDSVAHQSILLRLSLTGSATQDVDLSATKTIVNSGELTFTSWDEEDIRIHSLNEVDTQTFRVIFDFHFGDQDEFLDLTEFEVFVQVFSSFPDLPSTSLEMFLVDSTPFDLVPGSDMFTFINISGSIDSLTPPEYELTGSYVSSTTIPSASTHTVDLYISYDSTIVKNVYTIRFPSPDLLLAFSASAAVSVSGLGTDTAIVDPGLDPNPSDSVMSEWMSLDAGMPDTTAPTVSGTTDTPDPVELGAAVLIETQVSDARGIASVKVEIRLPTGGLVGNFTMSHPSGTRYTYQFSPSVTGTYPYKITATDTSGNHAVVSGTFLARDTTPPVANAGPNQAVNEGTTVTFDGGGSSDLAGIVSYKWTFNDDGSVTLTGPSPTHRFDNPGTYTVTLTVTDAAGNSETDTVVVTVAATTGSVEGTVIGPSGQAISGATVRLLSGATEVASTTTDTNGQFTFAEVTPGTYTLRIEAAGFETKSASVTVTAGDVEPVSVNLTALQAAGVLGLALEIWGLIIAVVAIVVVGLLLVRRRPKRPAQTPPSGESSDSESL